MNLDLHRLQPRRFLFRLRLTGPARFPFFHGGVLRGLFSRALGTHELPPGLVPVVCESGRVLFREGMPYHLGLTLIHEPVSWAKQLEEGLRRLGAAKGSSSGPTLGGNFQLEEVTELPRVDLAAEAERLAGLDSLRLFLVSPLRLQRPSRQQRKGEGFLDDQCFPLGHFLDRLARRVFLLSENRYPDYQERSAFPPVPEGASADSSGLLWLDVPAPGRRRKARTLGGSLGEVRLEGLPAAWAPVLAAGQFAHAGSSIAFGLGRFVVAGPSRLNEALAADPFRPARPLLADVADPILLSESLDHVLGLSEAAGIDGETPEDLLPRRGEALRSVVTELETGLYRAPALRGVLLREDDGGLRPLAIPTVRDRAVQRAAAQVLSEPVDTLLEDSSFAYRRGYSRQGAANAIRRAYEAGYRYVLDADIRGFFDNVDWSRLFRKLRALFPFEPLRSLVEAWVQAPVELEGQLLPRKRGLPQGSPVAPLLANLYLDQFDDDLLGADFRLIRYADDFVVLCRNLERAREAHEAAKRALAELGLELNEEKTAVRSMDEGFTYLGYLFCRSLVLESRDEPVPEGKVRPLEPEDVPASSWLAEVPFARVRELVLGKTKPGRKPQVELVPLAAPTATLQLPRPLYVTSPEARLSLEDGSLQLAMPGAEERSFPLGTLSHVVFVGRPVATLPLLLALAEAEVPIFFCRADGELFATLGPYEADWHLWQEQARLAEDESRQVAFAREVAAAKLANSATLAVRFGWEGATSAAAELRELARACENKTEVESLLGLEGRGAAVYFQALAASLPEEWGFAGRRRQPPPDPVNALLSFGYTLLHHHVATALTVKGLNPRIGLFHQGRGTHQALASDLQEELRFVVEALVWSLVRQRRLKAEDFAPTSDGRYPCLLTRAGRRVFLEAFERRLLTQFTPPGAEEPLSYREFIAAQALAFKRLVTGEASHYRALRIRA